MFTEACISVTLCIHCLSCCSFLHHSHYNAKCKIDLSFILYYIIPVFVIFVSLSSKALLGIFVSVVTILQTLSVKSTKTHVTGWLSPKLWQTTALIEAAGFPCTWLVVTAINGIAVCVCVCACGRWGQNDHFKQKKILHLLVWNYLAQLIH